MGGAQPPMALLCLYKNHLKGHFVSHKAEEEGSSGSHGPTSPGASFRAPCLAGKPQNLCCPLPALGRGCRSYEAGAPGRESLLHAARVGRTGARCPLALLSQITKPNSNPHTDHR